MTPVIKQLTSPVTKGKLEFFLDQRKKMILFLPKLSTGNREAMELSLRYENCIEETLYKEYVEERFKPLLKELLDNGEWNPKIHPMPIEALFEKQHAIEREAFRSAQNIDDIGYDVIGWEQAIEKGKKKYSKDFQRIPKNQVDETVKSTVSSMRELARFNGCEEHSKKLKKGRIKLSKSIIGCFGPPELNDKLKQVVQEELSSEYWQSCIEQHLLKTTPKTYLLEMEDEAEITDLPDLALKDLRKNGKMLIQWYKPDPTDHNNIEFVYDNKFDWTSNVDVLATTLSKNIKEWIKWSQSAVKPSDKKKDLLVKRLRNENDNLKKSNKKLKTARVETSGKNEKKPVKPTPSCHNCGNKSHHVKDCEQDIDKEKVKQNATAYRKLWTEYKNAMKPFWKPRGKVAKVMEEESVESVKDAETEIKNYTNPLVFDPPAIAKPDYTTRSKALRGKKGIIVDRTLRRDNWIGEITLRGNGILIESDGSVGATGPVLPDAGADFLMVPEEIAKPMLLAGAKKFSVSDRVKEATTESTPLYTLRGDFVLHVPEYKPLVFQGQEIVVMDGDEILMSHGMLHAIGVDVYAEVESRLCKDEIKVIDGNLNTNRVKSINVEDSA